MFQVVYIPKVEDEVIVAEFDSIEEAESHMELIKVERPNAFPHHYIKEK
jgi:hypothetical protein